jgi:hypothetical protein
VKVPQTITHDKVLVDCDAEIAEFLETMDILGDKLGPIIFQFPFFSSAEQRWVAVLGLRSFAYPCRTGEVDSAQDGRPGRQCVLCGEWICAALATSMQRYGAAGRRISVLLRRC